MRKLFLVILWAVLPALLFARVVDPDKPLPNDPEVRTGVLPNGMRYYIRHNDNPPGLAHFEIFHAVGALQEEDNQNGLAHFLEHMAFNGLGHFPGRSMMDYMESIGVKWGANLNAATAADYTRYLIKDVPVTRQGIIDTCLLVLYDWSGSILADPATLDNERGVIEEEWRSRGGAQFRISEAVIPCVYNNSKYARRNVIGDMEIIRSFMRDELMDFYHTWYRPDMQAVAVVGDLDVDRMEREVVALFSMLPKAENPRPKEEYNIPDNEELLYVAYGDPEVTSSSFEILYKHPARAKEERPIARAYLDGYYNSLVVSMMNSRLGDKLNNGQYSLTGAQFSYSALAGDRDVFSVSGESRSGADNIVPAIEMALAESERMRRYGFVQGEVDRVLANARSAVERSYIERNERSNGVFINAWFANFLHNIPYMDAETYRNVLLEAIAGFTVEEANARVKRFFGDRNQIVTIITSSSEAVGVPSQSFMASALEGMADLAVEPYKEKQLRSSLMTEEPVPGKVVSERESVLGAVEWTLSNGAKVYVQPTDRHDNEIQMGVMAEGGHSNVPDEMFASARMVSSTLSGSGVADLSETDLRKMLAGKKVYVTPLYSEYVHGFDCATTPADLETTLQLLHLYFTQPRFDRETLDRRLASMRESLASRHNMPFAYLQDTVVMRRSDYHPRASLLISDPADLDRVGMGQICEIYATAFDNPQQFTYVLTGTLDLEKVRPLVEKYIGSLRGTEHTDRWRDLGRRPPKGHATADFKRPMEQPVSTIFVEYTQVIPEYDYRQSLRMGLLQQVLEPRMTRIFRTERGATYSVNMEGSASRLPVPILHLIISFQTKPELLDELRPLIDRELRTLAAEGIDPEDLAKAKEYMAKVLVQNQESNFYWEGRMKNYIRFGELYGDPVEVLESITTEEVHTVLKGLIDADNVLTVIMRPE